MSKAAPIAGLILAGGQSRRMGGEDKSFIELAGRPLIERVIERMRPQVDILSINTNSQDKRYADLNLPIIPDVVTGFQGPLAGLHAGLKWIDESGVSEWLATCSCDTPFLPNDYVARLMAEIDADNSRATVAAFERKAHPTIGVWHRSLLRDVDRWLNAEGRMFMAFADEIGARHVDFTREADANDPFANLNTPADLVAAEKRLQ